MWANLWQCEQKVRTPLKHLKSSVLQHDKVVMKRKLELSFLPYCYVCSSKMVFWSRKKLEQYLILSMGKLLEHLNCYDFLLLWSHVSESLSHVIKEEKRFLKEFYILASTAEHQEGIILYVVIFICKNQWINEQTHSWEHYTKTKPFSGNNMF